MLLGQIFQSIEAWRKLSSVSMSPVIAYKILKYTKRIADEYDIAEKQRVALLYAITGTKQGQEVRLESTDPKFIEYVQKLDEIMSQEVDFSLLELSLEGTVDDLSGKDIMLSASDLAKLEPFFSDAGDSDREEA